MKARWLLVMSVAALVAGCGETAQTAAGKKSDAKPWEGAADSPFVVSGWKAGDRASWEEQMRHRAQSQNEYTRVPAK
jgi:hypothetical protein